MLLCISRAIKIIFRGACIGKLAEVCFTTYLAKSTGTLWIFILMSTPVMKYIYIVVYKDCSSWITWYKLKGLDGGATKADGGASAPVGPSVATPLDKRTKNNARIIGQIELMQHYIKPNFAKIHNMLQNSLILK